MDEAPHTQKEPVSPHSPPCRHRRVGSRLSAVLDISSRLIVGWAMASHREKSLVEAVLWMSLGRCQPRGEHLDRGESHTNQSGLPSRPDPVSHPGEQERKRRLL